MAKDPVKNFAKCIVSGGYTSVATVITLQAGEGAKLPDPAVDGAFNLPWWNYTDYKDSSDDPNKEIVRVTARTNDVLTVTRAQEGTIASNKNNTDKVYYMARSFTKNDYDKFLTADYFHSATEKTTPVDADELTLLDSAASFVLKKFSFLNLKLGVMSAINPIGTIREFNVATNPATLLGFGTWSAFGTGRVTVAIDAGQTEFDANGEIGGEKAHTLTIPEMPSHTHTFTARQSGSPDQCPTSTGRFVTAALATTDSAGGGGAHNNLQPYIVVYRWVRTA